MPTLDSKGATFRAILVEVFRLRALLVTSAEKVAASAGLTSARWQVLGAVEHAPATVAQVARDLGLTRQSVQETADRMAADGLVAFHDNPGHKRARLMAPTARARKALEALRPREVQFANLLGAGHSREALQATLAVLRKAREMVESADRSSSR